MLSKRDAYFIKAILDDYPFTKQLQKLNSELWEFETLINDNKDRIKANVIHDMPRQHGIGNPTLDSVIKTLELYEKTSQEIQAQIERLIKQRNAIDTARRDMRKKERELFDEVYVNRKPLKTVGIDFGLDTDRLYNFYRMHSAVLQKIKVRLKENGIEQTDPIFYEY